MRLTFWFLWNCWLKLFWYWDSTPLWPISWPAKWCQKRASHYSWHFAKTPRNWHALWIVGIQFGELFGKRLGDVFWWKLNMIGRKSATFDRKSSIDGQIDLPILEINLFGQVLGPNYCSGITKNIFRRRLGDPCGRKCHAECVQNGRCSLCFQVDAALVWWQGPRASSKAFTSSSPS